MTFLEELMAHLTGPTRTTRVRHSGLMAVLMGEVR